MWGSWIALSLIGVVALALVMGLAVLGSPLFAVLIAAVLGGGLLLVAAFRRSSEYVEGEEGGRREHDIADITSSRGNRHGAPAGGEGGVPPERR